MEIKKELKYALFGNKTYEVNYQCDTCKDDIMESTGEVLESMPPQYPHSCSKCGATENFNKKYPITICEVKE